MHVCLCCQLFPIPLCMYNTCRCWNTGIIGPGPPLWSAVGIVQLTFTPAIARSISLQFVSSVATCPQTDKLTIANQYKKIFKVQAVMENMYCNWVYEDIAFAPCTVDVRLIMNTSSPFVALPWSNIKHLFKLASGVSVFCLPSCLSVLSISWHSIPNAEILLA